MCQDFENTEATLTKCVVVAALVVCGAGLILGWFNDRMEAEIAKPKPMPADVRAGKDPGAAMDRMAQHSKERVK